MIEALKQIEGEIQIIKRDLFFLKKPKKRNYFLILFVFIICLFIYGAYISNKIDIQEKIMCSRLYQCRELRTQEDAQYLYDLCNSIDRTDKNENHKFQKFLDTNNDEIACDEEKF